jgi:hypothetical protein
MLNIAKRGNKFKRHRVPTQKGVTMQAPDAQPAMSQQIFRMGLSTEAISLYLLCCHLQDSRTPISRDTIGGFWNGSAETLEKSIKDLQERRILHRRSPSGGDGAVYELNEPKYWQM